MARKREYRAIPPNEWPSEVWAVVRHEQQRGGERFHVEYEVGSMARLIWQAPMRSDPTIKLPCAIPAATQWLQKLYPELMTSLSVGSAEEIAAINPPAVGAQLDLF
jgi:hypothetical protein